MKPDMNTHTEDQSMEDEREAFERYFAASRKNKGVAHRPTFERREDDTYADDHTQRHWWTWQNARAALRAPAGVPSGSVPPGADDIVQTIALAMKRGYTPAEILDENSPIADRIRAHVAARAPAEVPLSAAIAWVEKRRDDFIDAHGHTDPDTGATEYGTGSHAHAKEEYVCELEEIIEGLRAIAATKEKTL
jgi:hypothetical protein